MPRRNGVAVFVAWYALPLQFAQGFMSRPPMNLRGAGDLFGAVTLDRFEGEHRSLVQVGLAAGQCRGPPDSTNGSYPGYDARCWITVSFPNSSCGTVREEMVMRLKGGNGKHGFRKKTWEGPRKGVFTLLDVDDSLNVVDGSWETPYYYSEFRLTYMAEQFTDKVGCKLFGCSQGNVTDGQPPSCQYCNMRNLYCGKDNNCTVVEHDFSGEYIEDFARCPSHDSSACTTTTTTLAEYTDNATTQAAVLLAVANSSLSGAALNASLAL